MPITQRKHLPGVWEREETNQFRVLNVVYEVLPSWHESPANFSWIIQQASSVARSAVRLRSFAFDGGALVKFRAVALSFSLAATSLAVVLSRESKSTKSGIVVGAIGSGASVCLGAKAIAAE